MNPLLPFARVFGGLVSLRNSLFDRGYFKEVLMDKPVISIGNLSLGGTGKTPLTAKLAVDLQQRGFRVGIVSRGYGGWDAGPSLVRQGDPKRYGDEPSWYVSSLQGIQVAIAHRRVEAARLLESSVDVILADDGYQHRWLHRTVNILVLDASMGQAELELFPAGQLREPVSAADRATDIFVSKYNLRKNDSIVELAKGLQRPLIFWNHRLKEPSSFAGTRQSVLRGKVLLVSGVARPESFEQLVRENPSLEVAGHLVFGDHFKYGHTSIEAIEKLAAESGAENVLTTEKDAIKLKQILTGPKSGLEWWSVRLSVEPESNDLYQEWLSALANRIHI